MTRKTSLVGTVPTTLSWSPDRKDVARGPASPLSRHEVRRIVMEMLG